MSRLLAVVAVIVSTVAGCTAVMAPASGPDGPEMPDRQQLIEALEADPRYAGMWAEQEVLLVALTGGVDEVSAAVAHLVPPGLVVRWQLAEHSYADLRALQDEIAGAHLGDLVIQVAVDPQLNRVVVGVDPLTAEAVARLHRLYGERIHVVHSAIQRQLNHGLPGPTGAGDPRVG
jgi:hypothetical protein